MSDATNLVEGSYSWSLTAEAEGGAVSARPATGTMDVQIVCTAELLAEPESSFTFDLTNPDDGVDGTLPENFPDSSTAYISLPPRSASDSLPEGIECSQIFTFEVTGNENILPENL